MAEGYELLYVQLEGLHLEEGEGEEGEDSQPASSGSGGSSGCSSSAASYTGGLFAVLPLRRRRSSQRLAALAAKDAED